MRNHKNAAVSTNTSCTNQTVHLSASHPIAHRIAHGHYARSQTPFGTVYRHDTTGLADLATVGEGGAAASAAVRGERHTCSTPAGAAAPSASPSASLSPPSTPWAAAAAAGRARRRAQRRARGTVTALRAATPLRRAAIRGERRACRRRRT